MGVATVIVADPHDRTVAVATQERPLSQLQSPLVVSITVPGSVVDQFESSRATISSTVHT